MDVVAGEETFDHVLVGREVGYESEFDLRVVGTHDKVTRIGDECAAYLTSVVRTDGNVLEIGIG